MTGHTGVKQVLFVGRDPRAGCKLEFVFLESGECGIARDGAIYQTWSDDDDGIESALAHFHELSRGLLSDRHEMLEPALRS
jgi:hypothetical protein